MLSTNIKPKLILTKFLRYKFIIYKNIFKPKINKDISQLVQPKATKTLL